MQKYIRISKYHFGIIIAYLIATPLLWLTMPQIFRYGFDGRNTGEVVLLIVLSILGFAIYERLFRDKEIRIKLNRLISNAPLLLLYSLYFAIPEELIFRGAIQNYLQAQASIGLAIILASIVFGVVHLPNGARGLGPTRWNWQFAIIAFLGGLVFGSIFALTQSLLISTLLHTFFLFMLMLKATKQ